MDNTIGALPKVRFGEWIGEGWNMFAEQWKVWVVNALMLSLVTVVPIVGMYIFMVVLAAAAGSGGAGVGLAVGVLVFLGVILVILVSTYFPPGMYRTAFKQLRGRPNPSGDLFSAGGRFPPL